MKLAHIRTGGVVHLMVDQPTAGVIFLCGRWSSWGHFTNTTLEVNCKRGLKIAAETGDEA